jgi:hypothetical protein
VYFQLILIGSARSAGTAVLYPALQLRKSPQSPSKVQIIVEQISLEQIAIRVLRPSPEGRIFESLVTQPRFAAQAHVPTAITKLNIFKVVCRVASTAWVFIESPIFLEPERPIGRRSGSDFRDLRVYLPGSCNYNEKCKNEYKTMNSTILRLVSTRHHSLWAILCATGALSQRRGIY